MVNMTFFNIYMTRKQGVWAILGSSIFVLNWVYIVFSFPVEDMAFHRRAISDLPYSQAIRDSYTEEFPDTWKALKYRQINQKLETENQTTLQNL
jgi:hypothetical protein